MTYREFHKGQEVFLSYGDGNSNQDLLFHYGIMMPHNKYYIHSPCDGGDDVCVAAALEQYNTSVGSDIVALASKDLSFNMRNILQLRQEEKLALLNMTSG